MSNTKYMLLGAILAFIVSLLLLGIHSEQGGAEGAADAIWSGFLVFLATGICIVLTVFTLLTKEETRAQLLTILFCVYIVFCLFVSIVHAVTSEIKINTHRVVAITGDLNDCHMSSYESKCFYKKFNPKIHNCEEIENRDSALQNHCFRALALHRNDPSLCPSDDDYIRSECRTYFAIKLNDSSFCNDIRFPVRCQHAVEAILHNDYTKCDELFSKEQLSQRFSCKLDVAAYNQDISICERVLNDTVANISRVQHCKNLYERYESELKSNNPSFCITFPTALQNKCVLDMALRTNNQSHCDSIKFSYFEKHWCLSRVESYVQT